MIIFKDPVPKGVNRGEAMRMGRDAAELHGFKHGYEAEAFTRAIGGEADPLSSRLRGESFDLAVFKDGSFETNSSSALLSVMRTRFRQVTNIGHYILHLDRSDPDDLRMIVPPFTHAEPNALQQCRREAMNFAMGALLSPQHVQDLASQGKSNPEILRLCCIPVSANASFDALLDELKNEGMPDPVL